MRGATLAAALGLLAAGCAANPKPRTLDAGVVPAIGAKAEGIASWYGPGYEGKRTSSGERFDPGQLTAAHATWAFGVRARVTLVSTGKSVEVRINDRLPRRDRVIDLSKEAAKRIGLIGPGTGKVRIEVVGVPGDDGT